MIDIKTRLAALKKKRLDSSNFLLFFTICLFVVMYLAGVIVYHEQGFGRMQTFLNMLIDNAGLLVAASGMAGMGSPNSIHTRKVTKRFYLCGDEVSDVADTIGLVAPRVMLCAAHQAHTVLRILAGEYEV